MNFKLDKLIEKKQLSLFFTLSFFFIFLSFVLSKGFIENQELSDKIFLISCVLSFEIIYLILSNKFINYQITNIKDYLILFIFFIFTFVIWNYESVVSYLDLSWFFIFHLFLVLSIFIFINLKSTNIFNENKYDNILLITILSIFLSGIFYQLEYSSLENFLIIIILSVIILISNFILKKSHHWVDIFLSIVVFFILIKVFLLSSSKDAFHYSWILGPVNSLESNYSLLVNIVSQYGYFNALIINIISQLTTIESTHVLIIFMIGLFIIFYIIFLLKILEFINLPLTICALFLSFLIFGNIGHYNFSGSMLIPSSSVFRFLPSLITIILFSSILDQKYLDNLKKLIFFYLSLLVSLIWSFESAFFTIFSLGSFFLMKLILNFNYLIKYKFDFYLVISKFKYSIFLGLLLFIILYLLFKDKDITLFYEHALKSKSSLPEEIKNNKITLFFLFLLLSGYLILRDTLDNKKLFCQNILWFALFVSISAYFLIRSVDSNIFNILPFVLFIICSMKADSKQIQDLKKIMFHIIIFFIIISSLFATIINKDKFFNNLFNSNILVVPEFLSKNYRPQNEILNTIDQYKGLPLTLITGKTIHNPNINLPSFGYGLPVLPLEQFNILNIARKQNLIDIYFDKKNDHLLLCIYECDFYYSENDNNIYQKFFLGINVEFKKILEIERDNIKETLYLLSKT